MVLLRGADARGFAFHTNYTSRKARELTDNPFAALCLHWPTLEEQIRIEGTVERLPADESDAYFAGRPRGEPDRRMGIRTEHRPARPNVLEARLRDCEEQFEGRPVPRPPFWGGFRLVPVSIEFWHGETTASTIASSIGVRARRGESSDCSLSSVSKSLVPAVPPAARSLET